MLATLTPLLLGLNLVAGVGGLRGGRGIGRFILFRLLFRSLGPVWGIAVLVAIIITFALLTRSNRRWRR